MNKIDKENIVLFLALCISLFIGFYLNEDTSGGGSRTDFNSTLPYIEGLKENFFSYLINWENIHLPFHYILLSFFHLFFNNVEILRIFFCLLSLSIPILFYKNLKLRYEKIDNNILFLFASSIILLPTFRYTAIWTNVQITAQIFFLLSTFYFIKWNIKNIDFVDKNLVLQIFFMALSVYTRQDYATYFLYFMILLLTKLKLINFIKLSLFVIFLSLPGIWFVLEQGSVTNIKFTFRLQNSLLINSSMLSFYLAPIFLLVAINNKNFFTENIKFILKCLIFFIIIVTFLSYKFDYNSIYEGLGGGFILKASLILFDSNLLFYISSVIGFVMIAYLSRFDKNNLIFFLLIFIGYNADIVYQKYFEPIFLFSLFLIVNTKITSYFLNTKKNIFILYIYFGLYYSAALANQIFSLTKI